MSAPSFNGEDRTMDPERTSGFHPVNLTHLIMGVALACFAGMWAAIVLGPLELDALRWVLPVPWLAAGTAGLVAATVGRRRPGRGATTTTGGRATEEPWETPGTAGDEPAARD